MLKAILLIPIILNLIASCAYADIVLVAGTYGNGCYGNGAIQNVTDFELDSSQYLSRANASVADIKFGDVDFSIAGWVYLESKASNGSSNVFLSLNNPTGNQRSYTIQYNNSGGEDRFAFSLSNGGAAPTVLNDSVLGSPSLSTWYFIVISYNAATDAMTMNINNGASSSTSQTGGGYSSTTADFRFGSNGNGALFFDGKLSNWSIWNRVLTTPEKSQLYNNGLGSTYATYQGSKSGLLHWYPLNNMSDVTTMDYDLTNNGATFTAGFIYGCS